MNLKIIKIAEWLIIIVMLLYPAIGFTEINKGIQNAPKSLAEVKEFKWFIFASTHPYGSSECKVEIDEIIKVMAFRGVHSKFLKIEMNPDGGANDIFMFRIEINTMKVEGLENTCVLSVNTELAYYDKLGYVPNSNTPPFNANLVLWRSPQYLNTIQGDKDSISVLLGKDGATQVAVSLDYLINLIHSANKNGFKYMDLSIPTK